MRDGIGERIAAALERQVEQHEESVVRHNAHRLADLERLRSNRDADLDRIRGEHQEVMATNNRLMEIMADAILYIKQQNERLDRLESLEKSA